jgi:hypothetical protein
MKNPKRGQGTGTSTRRLLDIARFREAMRAPGLDPRLWVSYGTVGTVGDDGSFDPSDTLSIYIGPEGIEADVLLEPLRIPVTCIFPGVQGGGAAQIITPLRPGDRVVVGLPDGSTGGPPVIMAILNSAAVPVPLGADRKPIAQNDRVMVYGVDVPIDIRTAGGARVQVQQDGTVILNEGARGVARLDDTVRLHLDSIDLFNLATALVAAGLTGTPAPTGTPLDLENGVITSASDTVRAGG